MVKSFAVKLETTHKPAKPPTNHPQTTQTIHKSPQTQPIMSRKSLFYVAKLQQQYKTCAKFATILLHFINI